jgi:hypothetical protein
VRVVLSVLCVVGHAWPNALAVCYVDAIVMLSSLDAKCVLIHHAVQSWHHACGVQYSQLPTGLREQSCRSMMHPHAGLNICSLTRSMTAPKAPISVSRHRHRTVFTQLPAIGRGSCALPPIVQSLLRQGHAVANMHQGIVHTPTKRIVGMSHSFNQIAAITRYSSPALCYQAIVADL